MKRFLSIILTLCLVMAMTVPALAADNYTPYGTNTTVKVDGITYYDVFGTGGRDISESALFLKQVLEAVPAKEDGYGKAMSLDQRWRSISKLAIITYGMDIDYQYNDIIMCIRRMNVNDPKSYAWKNYPLTIASSVKTADDAMREKLMYDNKMPPANTDLAGMTDGQTVFWALDFVSPNPDEIKDGQYRWNDCSVAIGTIFYDFKLSYLNTGSELESGINGLTPEEAAAQGAPGFTYSSDNTGSTYAGGVKNLSASEITASQSLATQRSLTIENSFSSTQAYGIQEMIGTESKLIVGIPGIGSMESLIKTELTASQTFTSQSGSSTSNSETESVENSISVVLPAHTEVMLEQSTSNIGMTIEYDYPVVISYKVKTVILSNQTYYSGINKMSNETVTTYGNEYPMHSNAVDNYYLRVMNAAVSGYEATYGDNIDWYNNFNSFYGIPADMDGKERYEILEWKPWWPDAYPKYLNVNRPMSVTGGSLSISASGTSSTIYGITPIYPLYRISTDRAYDYDMTSGEQLYVDNIALRGVNSSGVAYYGFNSQRGRWVLVDPDGSEIQNSDVAKLETNPVSGYTSLIAGNNPGTVYLKYIIDENIYSYSTSTQKTTNSELASTAVVKVNVSQTPFEGGIEVSGTVTGYVGDPAINLDDCEGLSAAVTDSTGKHLDRPIVWDQKELESEGIKVENNYLTFTEAGTFHICASSGGVSSEWVTVTANPARALNQLEIADNTQPSVLTVEIQGGTATTDLSPLAVSALDQYEAAWSDLSELKWMCGDPAVTISGTDVTVSAAGTYFIYAQIGNIKSNTLMLIADTERALASIEITDMTDPSILTVDVQGGAEAADLSLLTVSALNQFSGTWTDLTGLEWKCDNADVAISGTTATVSKSGIYDIYAQIGDVKSNVLTLTAYDGSVTVTAITPQYASMSRSGGSNVITITGTNLPNGVVVAAFNSSGGEIARQTSTGDGSKQTCTLSLPANSSTATAAIYTIKYSLDGGVNYKISPTATVSVAAASGGGGGGGGGGGSTVTIPDTDVPLANLISFSGFINGYSDGNFHGEDIITREQFVAILYRLNAKDTAPADKTKPSFMDVASDRWSYDAIEWALSEGIIECDENGNFRPGDPLTRAEMAVMFIKSSGVEELAENTFSDLQGHKDADYILKAVKAGIFNGYPDGTFGPDDNTTRAQAVTALIRHLLGGEPMDQMLKDLKAPFVDVPKTYWAYDYVLLAVHGYTEIV